MNYGDNAEVWAECKRLNNRIANAEQGVIGLDKTIGAQSAQILELIRRVTELEQLAYSQSVLLAELGQSVRNEELASQMHERAVAYTARVGAR